jgi:hypothetical protein
MIVPSLYADLRSRGVALSIAETPKAGESNGLSVTLPPLRLRVQAPDRALDGGLCAAIRRHRDELLQFVFELEERAAILEYEQGHSREQAEELARGCVIGGHASPDGRLWLQEYALNHPTVEAFLKTFGGEIVELRRATPEEMERVA